jgi:transcriptional regulator of nitric oxide reductase
MTTQHNTTPNQQRFWPTADVAIALAVSAAIALIIVMPATREIGIALIYIAISLAIYFVPWIVAHYRHHRRLPIFLRNFFLGWTLVGWVAALVWAVMPKDGSKP